MSAIQCQHLRWTLSKFRAPSCRQIYDCRHLSAEFCVSAARGYFTASFTCISIAVELQLAVPGASHYSHVCYAEMSAFPARISMNRPAYSLTVHSIYRRSPRSLFLVPVGNQIAESARLLDKVAAPADGTQIIRFWRPGAGRLSSGQIGLLEVLVRASLARVVCAVRSAGARGCLVVTAGSGG